MNARISLMLCAAAMLLAGCAAPRNGGEPLPRPRPRVTPPRPALPPPARYRIISAADASFRGRTRTTLRVVIEDRNASPEAVHAALLQAAKGRGAIAVMVFAYWPGDDTDFLFTAGRLEWSADRRGWDGETQVEEDGKFDQ